MSTINQYIMEFELIGEDADYYRSVLESNLELLKLKQTVYTLSESYPKLMRSSYFLRFSHHGFRSVEKREAIQPIEIEQPSLTLDHFNPDVLKEKNAFVLKYQSLVLSADDFVGYEAFQESLKCLVTKQDKTTFKPHLYWENNFLWFSIHGVSTPISWVIERSVDTSWPYIGFKNLLGKLTDIM